MAKHLDVQARARISSSPRSRPSTSPSPAGRFGLGLGPAFGDSITSAGRSVATTTPTSPLPSKFDDDFFTAKAVPSDSPTRTDASARLAFHRMRFLALDSSPLLDGDETLVPSVLGPPLSQTRIMREKTPPLLTPRSSQKRRGGGGACSNRSAGLGDTDDSGYSGSEEDCVPTRTLSLSPAPTPRRSRLEPKLGGPGHGLDSDECTQPRLLPIDRTRSPRPAIVSTPPETPRRHRTLPATPPRSRPSTSSSKYHLPRSPGTPHLGRTSELIRTPGSPMPRSPGCRSLSSLT